MTRTTAAWIAIVAVGLGTYAIRGSFLLVAHRVAEIPPRWRTPLRMIPPAVLAALTAPALLRPDGPFVPLGPRALAGFVAAVVAWWTRSILATILVGLAAAIGFEHLLG
jgi:branched-subunit amino acid transport protein